LIDPALPEITTASPLLHHSLGHDPDAKKSEELDPRFLKLGKQADQILQAAAPAIDRLGPIRLNHVGSWKLVAAGSMT
jgi:hypothetical protein